MESRAVKKKRGGQPKPLAEKRRHLVAVWVNDSELERIKINAKTAGQPVSAFARKIALQEIVQARPAEGYTDAMTHFVHLCGNINAISKNLHKARIGGTLDVAVQQRITQLDSLMAAVAEDVNLLRGLTHAVSEPTS